MASEIVLTDIVSNTQVSAGNINPLIQTLRQPGGDARFVMIGEAFDNVQQQLYSIENVLKNNSPSVDSISIDSADLLNLVVGNRTGPGQLTVYSGPPSYTKIGFIGTENSGTPVTVVSAINGAFITAAPHGLDVGDITLSAGSSDFNNNGYFEVATVADPTHFTVLSPPVANGTGGTSTLQFAGGWLKQARFGGTTPADAPVRITPQGDFVIDTTLSSRDATFRMVINDVALRFNTDQISGFTGLAIYKYSDSTSPVLISPGGIQIYDSLAATTKFFLNAASGNDTSMSLYNAAGIERIRLLAATTGGSLKLRDGTNVATITLAAATGDIDFKSTLTQAGSIVVNTDGSLVAVNNITVKATSASPNRLTLNANGAVFLNAFLTPVVIIDSNAGRVTAAFIAINGAGDIIDNNGGVRSTSITAKDGSGNTRVALSGGGITVYNASTNPVFTVGALGGLVGIYNQVTFQGSTTTTTTATAGGAGALPATPAGYMLFGLFGGNIKIPYYNV